MAERPNGFRTEPAYDPSVELLLAAEDVRFSWIRLLCPRGHFIANIKVVDIAGEKRSENYRILRPRGKDGEYASGGDSDSNHGFRFDDHQLSNDSGDSESAWVKHPRLIVRLRCVRGMRGKCSYDGSFGYPELTEELYSAVVAGRSEYRLTN
jgi:hypothetical protein